MTRSQTSGFNTGNPVPMIPARAVPVTASTRFACDLPQMLPTSSVSSVLFSSTDAAAQSQDLALVGYMNALCGFSREDGKGFSGVLYKKTTIDGSGELKRYRVFELLSDGHTRGEADRVSSVLIRIFGKNCVYTKICEQSPQRGRRYNFFSPDGDGAFESIQREFEGRHQTEAASSKTESQAALSAAGEAQLKSKIDELERLAAESRARETELNSGLEKLNREFAAQKMAHEALTFQQARLDDAFARQIIVSEASKSRSVLQNEEFQERQLIHSEWREGKLIAEFAHLLAQHKAESERREAVLRAQLAEAADRRHAIQLQSLSAGSARRRWTPVAPSPYDPGVGRLFSVPRPPATLGGALAASAASPAPAASAAPPRSPLNALPRSPLNHSSTARQPKK